MTATLTTYPVLMQPSRRYICYTGAPDVEMHIVNQMPDDDRCPVCGGEDWSGFPAVECPVCGDWACEQDADLFRAMHGCFGGSL